MNFENSIMQPRVEINWIGRMSDLPSNGNTNGGRHGQQHLAIKNIAVVQCDGFRCLAYRDLSTWRDFHTGKELPEVKDVVFTFSV
jgi:hypothetical protein